MLCAFFDIRYSTDDIRNHENGLKYGIVYIKNLHRIVANHQQRLATHFIAQFQIRLHRLIRLDYGNFITFYIDNQQNHYQQNDK